MNPKTLARIEALNGLLESFETSTVQPQELVEAVEAVMSVVESGNKELLRRLSEANALTKSEIDALSSEFTAADVRIKETITKLNFVIDGNTNEIRATLASEIKRIESLIPEIPAGYDDTHIYDSISEHMARLERIEMLITGENVRNALEVLPEGEKLSIDAIEGLRELLEDINSNSGSKVISGGVTRALVLQLIAENGGGGGGTWGSITGTLSDQTDLQTALDEKQNKTVVVSSNQTASLDAYYTNVASATYTDPTPAEGKGFIVFVRNGTATVGGVAYATAGTIIHRVFHSGSWSNYVYQVSGSTLMANIFIDQTPDNGTYGLLGGTVNGTNAVFTVSGGAYTSGKLSVYLNGQFMTQGPSNDYQETNPAAGTFTFITAPAVDSVITAVYQKDTTIATSIAGQATVDFGPATGENNIARVTVNTASAVTGSIIMVSPAGVSTSDHDPDDYQWDNISGYVSNIVDGVSFDIIATAPNGSFGEYSFNYVIN
jgi:hypothetical protein